ncbi:MAG: 23S rRNA (uracil(747)-C(5))-methyltransferase RlmC [Thiolinea sp.]
MECSYFRQSQCQSCRWLVQDYPAQLAKKQDSLRALLADRPVEHWLPPVASRESAFRNKAKMVALGAAHEPILGIISSGGDAVSLTDCPLYPADMQSLLQALPDWIRRAGIPPYNIRKAKGELKYILLTRTQAAGEFMLRFVLRSEAALERIRHALPELLTRFPSIRVVSANLQPVHMAILEGEREIMLSDATCLEENFNGVPLFIRPKSFFQTNPGVAEQLYRTAQEWSALLQPARIWDLFCGVGGFGLHCATADTELTGIEIAAEAIACAQRSAERLGLNKVSFAALDSNGFADLQTTAPDLLIVNPPRRGLGAELCGQVSSLSPPAIFYSSCNPETLARDLSTLPGYRIRQVQLFDMFPHTAHYEVLVWLESMRAVEHRGGGSD